MRILGLDYGSKTVGVAVSDPLGLTAQGIETIWRKKENMLRRTLARIEELVKEYEVDTIVVGLPKNMNGTLGFQSEYVLEFKKMLEEATGLEVILYDERLTTVEVTKMMISADLSRSKRKNKVDTLAATLILQSYLDSINR